jgi:general secretion pathway protein G
VRREGRGEKGEERRRRAGFTLIEILTVIVIITVLAGIVVGAAKYAQIKEARSRAQAQIAMMETALESYKNDNGFYPPSTKVRANNTANSILLYRALATGQKHYMTFKPNQLRDSGTTIMIPIACDPTNSTVPNVVLIDPFGVPYNYFNRPACSPDGQTNAATFDLWSYGPNNINDEGANDDITNWKPN